MQPRALITGTTHGIGRFTALELARAGQPVLMLCRNATLAADLVREIQGACPGAQVDALHCDLADLASVQAAGLQVLERFDRLSHMILNAGMAATRRLRTPGGMDLNFAVNHLGHFLLVELLRGRMMPGGRILTVASHAHARGRLDLVAVTDPAERIGTLPSYARSKLANVLHSLALARRLEGSGVCVNCLHPGIVATHLLPRWVQWVQRLVRGQMFDARRGAFTTLQLALSPDFAACHGQYFDEHARARPPAERARDIPLQEALWESSLEWVGPWLGRVSP